VICFPLCSVNVYVTDDVGLICEIAPSLLAHFSFGVYVFGVLTSFFLFFVFCPKKKFTVRAVYRQDTVITNDRRARVNAALGVSPPARAADAGAKVNTLEKDVLTTEKKEGGASCKLNRGGHGAAVVGPMSAPRPWRAASMSATTRVVARGFLVLSLRPLSGSSPHLGDDFPLHSPLRFRSSYL